MRRRETTHVAALLALAIGVRVALFDVVGIWGDFGFYTYDTRLITMGQRPFVDYLGRSPLFLYSFAAARGVVGHVVPLLRAWIIAWWLLTALPVYALTRHLHTHRGGLAAVALFTLAPFSLAYHMWANTQSMAAFFVVSAVAVVVMRDEPWRYPIAGVSVGLAFLARRSAVVVLGALGLYLVVVAVRRTDDAGAVVRYVTPRVCAAGTGFLATLIVGYGAVVGFDPAQTRALFVTHAVNLVLSVGRGGYPMLGVTDVPAVTNQLGSGRVPIFNDLCQLCGAWTARTFAKTILVASPIVGILWVYLDDWRDALFSERLWHYLAGVLLALSAYAAVRVVLAGYGVRAGAIIALVGIAAVVARTERVPRRLLYGGGMAFVLLVLAGYTAGYLYRNRFLHTYYFADFVPLLSVIGGMAYVEVADRADRIGRVVLAAAVVLAVVTSFLGAYPITVILLGNNEAGWFTTANVPAYQQDLEGRVDDDRVVWTGHPTYVAGSDVRLAGDVSRGHYLGATFRNDSGVIGPAARYYETVVIPGLRSGHIQFVIKGKMTHRMLRWNATASRLFEQKYCRVESADALYDRTNATLYRYQPDCETPPTVTENFTDI